MFSPLFITYFKIIFVLFPIGLVPDKPTNLTVINITSRSADVSWLDPKRRVVFIYIHISRFWIKLKKENSLIVNVTTGKVNQYKIDYLTPYTTYEVSVAAGNKYGFGEETTTSFSIASEEGEY